MVAIGFILIIHFLNVFGEELPLESQKCCRLSPPDIQVNELGDEEVWLLYLTKWSGFFFYYNREDLGIVCNIPLDGPLGEIFLKMRDHSNVITDSISVTSTL